MEERNQSDYIAHFQSQIQGPFGQVSMNERPQILTSTFIIK